MSSDQVSTRESIVHGPETVSWRIVLDPLMMVAGVRALMLQALHPFVMWGVWQNSTFLQDPLDRLFNTANFVAVTTVGTPEQADALGARVRAIHKRLRVKDPATGATRRIDEPEFLLWVHCAEVSSYLEVITRGGHRVTAAEADGYYDEQRHTAAYVGLHIEDVPGSVAAMDAYFTRARSELRVTAEAKATVRFLLWPTMPRGLRFLAPFKVFWAPFGLLAYYSLPRWARSMYGSLPELPGIERVVPLGLRVMRRVTLLVPRRVRGRAFKPETRELMLDVRRRLEALGVPLRGNLQKIRLEPAGADRVTDSRKTR
jgi:uncharacterized protein (DUF2236 family)